MEIRILKARGKIIKNENAFEMLEKYPANQFEMEKENEKKLQQIFAELYSLIGLNEVKKLIYEIKAFVDIRKIRQRESLYTEPLVLHMIFKGNPGTGKTTVARIIGKLFKELGVLTKGHSIEVERADLVGEYIGHTAQKTREQIKKAIGGVLFLDEAYSLARGGDKDFGKEAIDVMVKAMEDYKDNLILILAGYKDEMKEFIRSNPGLRSRFPIHINFPDYTINELLEIADLMVSKRQYQLDLAARASLGRILSLQIGIGNEYSGNARLVRNLIERAIRKQAVRLIEKKDVSRQDLITISKVDIEESKETCKFDFVYS